MNITNISNLSTEQIIENLHYSICAPALIMLFISFSVIFLIMGLILINKDKSGYSKFILIWVTSNLFGSLFLLFLIYSPFAIQNIKEFFISIFS